MPKRGHDDGCVRTKSATGLLTRLREDGWQRLSCGEGYFRLRTDKLVASRWQQAIEALQGSRRKHGKPVGKTDGRKRHMSAAARKRIGEAMKKRWAERKKKAA